MSTEQKKAEYQLKRRKYVNKYKDTVGKGVLRSANIPRQVQAFVDVKNGKVPAITSSPSFAKDVSPIRATGVIVNDELDRPRYSAKNVGALPTVGKGVQYDLSTGGKKAGENVQSAKGRSVRTPYGNVGIRTDVGKDVQQARGIASPEVFKRYMQNLRELEDNFAKRPGMGQDVQFVRPGVGIGKTAEPEWAVLAKEKQWVNAVLNAQIGNTDLEKRELERKSELPEYQVPASTLDEATTTAVLGAGSGAMERAAAATATADEYDNLAENIERKSLLDHQIQAADARITQLKGEKKKATREFGTRDIEVEADEIDDSATDAIVRTLLEDDIGFQFAAHPNEYTGGVPGKLEGFAPDTVAAFYGANATDEQLERITPDSSLERTDWIRYITDDERATLNKLFAYDVSRGDKQLKRVGEYIALLEWRTNNRAAIREMKEAAAFAEEHPVLASIQSVGDRMVAGAGYIEGAARKAGGEDIDPNSPLQRFAGRADVIRSTVGEEIRQTYGDGAAFAYDTVMSMADSAASMLAGMALGAPGMSLFIQGSAAGTAAMQSALAMGATDEKALGMGLAAGLAEGIFEKFSLDSFLKATGPAKNAMLKNVLKQASVEASEEVLTEITNIIVDNAVMGGMSQRNTLVDAYMADGLTIDQANAKAMQAAGMQIVQAGVGGAISGGVFGAAAGAISTANVQGMKNEYRDVLVNEYGLDKKAATKMAGEFVDGMLAQSSSANYKADNAYVQTGVQNALNNPIVATQVEVVRTTPANTLEMAGATPNTIADVKASVETRIIENNINTPTLETNANTGVATGNVGNIDGITMGTGLTPYTQHEANNIMAGGNFVNGYNSNVSDFIDYTMQNRGSHKSLYLGRVNQEVANEINAQLNQADAVTNYNMYIPSDFIEKILSGKHADAKEALQGQTQVTPEILKRTLEGIAANPDIVFRSESDYMGKPAFYFTKNTSDGWAIALEVIQTKGGNLWPQTFYIRKKNPYALRDLNGVELPTNYAQSDGISDSSQESAPPEATGPQQAGDANGASGALPLQEFSNDHSVDSFNQRITQTVPKVNETVQERAARHEVPVQAQIMADVMQGELGRGGNKVQQAARTLYQNLVSAQEPLEAIGKYQGKQGDVSTVNDTTQLVRQAGGSTDYIVESALVDMHGNELGESFVDMIDNIPKDQINAYNIYAQSLHNIDRAAQGKAVYEGVTAEQSAAYVANVDKQKPQFREYTNMINEWWNTFGEKWLVESGLLSQDTYNAMREMYPNYIPTYRKGKNVRGGGGVYGTKVTPGKAVGKAKGGTSEVIPLQHSFVDSVNRIVRAARNNQLYTELYNFATSDPVAAAEYGVRLADNAQTFDAADMETFANQADNNALSQNKALSQDEGRYQVTAFVDGQAQTMNVSKDVYNALNRLKSNLTDDAIGAVANALRKVSGISKGFITGINAVFTITNIIRDLQTYLINTNTKNPFKAVSNLFKAYGQILKGGDTHKQFKAQGGDRSGYYGNIARDAQGDITSMPLTFSEKSIGGKLKKIFGTPFELINKFGQVTEQAPRLAEYIGTIGRLGDTPAGRRAATQAAADITVNFSRSAPVTKLVDSFTMYLNAGMQGFDKMARQLKNKPVQTLGRGALYMVLPSILLALVNKDNEHYEELDQRTKDNYFIIPNLNDLDENGDAQTFIKIPRSREYGALLGALTDRFFAAAESGDLGEEFKGYANTVAESILPPMPWKDAYWQPLLNLETNKDFAGRSIVPESMQNLEPQYQQDIKTSGIAKWIGETFNVSPKQADYLISSYLGYPGKLIQGATSQQVSGVGERMAKAFAEPFERAFTADPRYSSALTDELYNELDRLTTEVATNKHLDIEDEETAGNKRVVEKATGMLSEMRKYENEILASGMTANEKTEATNNVREQMNDIARNALAMIGKGEGTAKASAPVTPVELAKEYRKDGTEKKNVIAAMSYGIPAGDFYNYDQELSAIDGRLGDDTVANLEGIRKKEYIDSLDLPEEQTKYLYDAYEVSSKIINGEVTRELVEAKQKGKETEEDFYKQMGYTVPEEEEQTGPSMPTQIDYAKIPKTPSIAAARNTSVEYEKISEEKYQEMIDLAMNPQDYFYLSDGAKGLNTEAQKISFIMESGISGNQLTNTLKKFALTATHQRQLDEAVARGIGENNYLIALQTETDSVAQDLNAKDRAQVLHDVVDEMDLEPAQKSLLFNWFATKSNRVDLDESELAPYNPIPEASYINTMELTDDEIKNIEGNAAYQRSGLSPQEYVYINDALPHLQSYEKGLFIAQLGMDDEKTANAIIEFALDSKRINQMKFAENQGVSSADYALTYATYKYLDEQHSKKADYNAALYEYIDSLTLSGEQKDILWAYFRK